MIEIPFGRGAGRLAQSAIRHRSIRCSDLFKLGFPQPVRKSLHLRNGGTYCARSAGSCDRRGEGMFSMVRDCHRGGCRGRSWDKSGYAVHLEIGPKAMLFDRQAEQKGDHTETERVPELIDDGRFRYRKQYDSGCRSVWRTMVSQRPPTVSTSSMLLWDS